MEKQFSYFIKRTPSAFPEFETWCMHSTRTALTKRKVCVGWQLGLEVSVQKVVSGSCCQSLFQIFSIFYELIPFPFPSLFL